MLEGRSGGMEGLYENEICLLLDSVKEKLREATDATEGNNGTDGGGAVKVDVLEGIETEFGRLNQAIKQLEAEARTHADSTSRKALQNKVKQFKDDAKSLRQQFRAFKEREEKKRLTNGRSGFNQGTSEERERLAAVNQRMEEGTSSLQRSHQRMLEIEETAAGVSEQLSQNRATINSTRRKLDEANSLAGNARGILRRMQQNEQFKTLFAYGAMGIVAFCLLYLLYAMFFG